MSVKKILLYPNPILKTPSEEVTVVSKTIQAMIQDMEDTFYNSPGCVGIAAPQIGFSHKIIIIDATRAKKAKKNKTPHGKLICINPEIQDQSGTIRFREGCLSIPDFTGNVIRSEKITVSFLDQNLDNHRIECEGFESVIFQHEIDHLDGILFLDRVRSLKRDIFRRKKYL